MSKMVHPVFGSIEYDLSWEGEINLTLYGRQEKLILDIKGDLAGEFNRGQVQSFELFMDKKDELIEQAEEAIYKNYLEIYMDIRERVGEDEADHVAPHITKAEDMRGLIEPTHLLIDITRRSGIRIVGLLFNCTWDTSHGLAVRFDNEQLVEVGEQDIVI